MAIIYTPILLATLVGAAGAMERLPATLPVTGGVRRAIEAWRGDPAAWARWSEGRLESPDPWGMRVVLEVRSEENLVDLLDLLESEFPDSLPEWWVVNSRAGYLQVVVPYADLARLAMTSAFTLLREPYRARPMEAFTEAYGVLFGTDWQAEGLSGRKIRIGVLDVGFDGYEALLGEELPSKVETTFLGNWDDSQHGTAVSEVIHDLAPAATLYLYSFQTDVEFLAAVQEMEAEGLHLVNGSVGFDNVWPADGTSPYTQAVDALSLQSGALYLAAAGNENDRYRVGPLTLGDDGWVALDGRSPVWVDTAGGWVDVSFRWTDPFDQSVNDLDLFVLDESGGPCGSSEDRQPSVVRPREALTCHVDSDQAQVWIWLESGDVTGLDGYLYSYYGMDDEDTSGTCNLTLPGDTVEGVTVGAVALELLDEVADYSSRGPTEDGRTKPDLVAPAGVTTASMGDGGFAGTSAATPHVTGVAALALQADGRHMLAPELRDWLKDNTVDLGPEGVDDESGHGRLFVSDIPWRGCHGCGWAPDGSQVWSPLSLLWALVLLRRRRWAGDDGFQQGEVSPW